MSRPLKKQVLEAAEENGFVYVWEKMKIDKFACSLAASPEHSYLKNWTDYNSQIAGSHQVEG